MKRTLTVNLGGMVYHIDDDAYELLKEYLDQIKKELSGFEGAGEIYQDIESRLAEIIDGKLKNARQVVISGDVEDIIAIMGQPEDISGQSEGMYTKYEKKKYQRMYRDPDHHIIAGVCSGLAAYWRIDATLVRIAFVILTIFGMAGLLLYLILWIVLPEANTVKQKLEMRGKSVTLSSIKDFIVEEFNNVKRNFQKR